MIALWQNELEELAQERQTLIASDTDGSKSVLPLLPPATRLT